MHFVNREFIPNPGIWMQTGVTVTTGTVDVPSFANPYDEYTSKIAGYTLERYLYDEAVRKAKEAKEKQEKLLAEKANQQALYQMNKACFDSQMK